MIKPIFLILHLILFGCILNAQSIADPTKGIDRLTSFGQKISLQDSSYARYLPFTNIGPTVCSGRIADVEVNPDRPQEMYIAYASGGLWYTDNNATSMKPVFDQYASMTIGDIAVDWKRNIIWVGTGENNSSRSSYSGTGMYKSSDGGETWQWSGLAESHHIGRIILHPTNPNIVHVACIGALYSANENRGVYSSFDGGATWDRSLYIDAGTGAIDLVMDPSSSNTLYAATWERSRKAWDFVESGPGSGIYKTTNAGKTWQLLSTQESGFPVGAGVGRIGLEIVKTGSGTILYAIVDNQHERTVVQTGKDELTKVQLNEISKDSFLRLDDNLIRTYLEENNFPKKYTVDTIRQLMQNDVITPATLVDYTQDANSKLFDTQIIGPEVYKSTDKGRSWKRVHDDFMDNVFYTYGYYFGQIRASKNNPDKLYLLGVPVLKSDDGGKSWTSIGGSNVHADHHALWVNPSLEGHLILGNDGGLNISYDDGEHWTKCNHPQVAQFYSIAVDMAKPYNVYGGLQDNGVWVGPSNATASDRWHATGHHPYKSIMGGDGMQVAVDTRDNNTVYTGFQFGNYYQLTLDESQPDKRITPVHELGQHPFRWNWESPIHLSVHNQDILYMGADRVFRSFNQGGDFDAISDDLTSGSREGDVAYGTVVSLHESPLQFGLIYAGTDDGHVHVTRDGGFSWKKISDQLPQGLWVSSLQASAHQKGRVYLSLNGYRYDHFESYVFLSEDFGDTWTRIAITLPMEAVNVVREDPVNENILYIGTDHGLYTSLDRGQSVMILGDIPFAPVHDLVVHPRDKDLIAATHGRSLYKADVSYLQMLSGDLSDTLTCFAHEGSMYYSDRFGTRSASWANYYEPSYTFPVFSSLGGEGKMQVYRDSLMIYEQAIEIKRGLSYYTYPLEVNELKVEALNASLSEENSESAITISLADNGKYYAAPGKYQIRIEHQNKVSFADFEIKVRE